MIKELSLLEHKPGDAELVNRRPAKTFMVEVDFSSYHSSRWWKPGYFKSKWKDGYMRRVWWLCFAVAWVDGTLYDYNRYVASGATEWRLR